MTVATLPTSQVVSLLGGNVKIYVDKYANLKKLYYASTASVNGTQFIPLLDIITGANYTVPAATNLHIWGLEEWKYTTGAAGYTVLQFGYADDGSGTNFTMLLNLFAAFGGGASSSDNLNVITGNLTVPTGKIPQVKATCTATTATSLITLIGLETA